MKKNIQTALLSLTPMLFFVLMATFTSCDQERTKYYGGTTTINLKPNEKFLNMTWKENNIWVRTH